MERQLIWRGLVTCGAMLAAVGLMRIGLPGLDLDDLERVFGGPFKTTNLSVGALGVMPLLMAGFFVELLTLWRPNASGSVSARSFGFWRGDRGGTPADFAGRARLVYVVTLLLALFQAIGTAYMLRRLQLPGYPDSDWLIIATLVGGVFCHAALARVIDEQGLGPGLVIVFLCTSLGDLPQAVSLGETVLPSVLTVVAAAFVTLAILRPRPDSARVPLVPAGLVPALFASYTFVVLDPLWKTGTLPALAEGVANRVGGSFESTGGFELHAVLVDTAATAAAVLVSAVVVSLVLVRPSLLAALWAKATGEGDSDSWQRQLRPLLWLGIAISAGLSVAISLFDRGASYMKSTGLLASTGALLTCAVLDAIDAVRARPEDTVVWVDTRFAWVAPIREALRRAGIASTTQGAASGALLPLNGPLVATKIVVEATDAERAQVVIAETLSEQREAALAPSRRAPPAEAPVLPKRALAATVLAVLIGAAMIAWPTYRTIKEQVTPPPPGEAATLAFLLVDDESNQLERWGSGNFTAPDGIELMQENAPLGEGRGTALRPFATVRARGGESHALAGARLLEFLATVDVPPQRRWALEALLQDGDESPGWRSFLLKTDTPGPTDGDLRSVEISPDGPEQLRWMLHLEFTAQGGRLFEEITAANVKRRFAILVNDKIESAPVINQRITGTSAVITMGSGGTKEDATKLRDALRRSIRKR